MLIREKCVNMGHKSHILSLEAQITELKKSTKPVADLKPESADVAKFGMYAKRSYPPIVFEDPNATTKKMCRQCGRSDGHPPARCEANNVVCLNCRTYGHLTKMCENECLACGSKKTHATRPCPAVSAMCKLCRVRGHFANTKQCEMHRFGSNRNKNYV